ncbi:hypothetical protein ACIHIX_47160 [Streptomyces sp. NPDC051913]|uniref:hypothetical protein n=1 Tax=Streptomyces sp. NPDC051913 TaxID=3365676 RepID=UPI0037D01FCD
MELRFLNRLRQAWRAAAPGTRAPGARPSGSADEPGTSPFPASRSGDDTTAQLAATTAAFALSVACVLGLVDAGASPETAVSAMVACALVAQRFGQRPDGPDGHLQLV